MSHLLKALAAKSDDLSSISGTHIVKGENQLLQGVLYKYTTINKHMYGCKETLVSLLPVGLCILFPSQFPPVSVLIGTSNLS